MMSENANPNEHQKPLSDRLLDAAGISVDRLPMLNVIFDRMATYCADSFRTMSTSPSYFSLNGIHNGRLGDMLETYEPNAIAAVFHVPEWDSRILVGFDRDFIFTMIEVLFGADGGEPPLDEERSFTNVEIRVSQALIDRVGKALQAAFATISKITPKLERLETRMDFAVIGRRNSMAVCANLLLQALARGGELFVIIPHSALNPLRQSLTHVVSGDAVSSDPAWSRQMQTEIQRTEVELKAVLEERLLTLDEVANLRIGQVIALDATPRTFIRLECNDQLLYWCELGQSDGSYALRVTDPVDQKREFIDDILSR
ncbi:FliM/FliN family flagellar motor switch protein [Xanthobacteraceae bacterium Astr-EGSB]|uniref:flagellar motor switch protein FliM n=1 Tax=Astrobacterium formosum TaxID=3069710 RepID=UPI0027AE507F|nr:FliM/FliN family flagellar motor switch protein [Xanthobacteraceae bacterium Astr-EGSB]